MASIITIFGGDGFVGRYVVQALLKSGAQVRIASRNPKRGWFLKSQANLGQIAYIGADITRPETLAAALNGADAAINLVGILNGDFDLVHRIGACNVAEAAKTAGVSRFIQVSAIGADSASPSAYGRSKGQGDEAVMKAFPAATVIRPSIIFGREDQFINRFAGLIRLFPIVPIMSGKTKFQPVYVADVAKAIVAALSDPATAGQLFELGGPEVISMADLNRWIAKATGRKKTFLEVPDAIGGAMARFTGWLPGAPITKDQWLMLQRDNVEAVGSKGLAALGVPPTSLDAAAPGWLVQYKKHGRFGADA
jgi:uncharacterized protein YbjT (DUF2867 family)